MARKQITQAQQKRIGDITKDYKLLTPRGMRRTYAHDVAEAISLDLKNIAESHPKSFDVSADVVSKYAKACDRKTVKEYDVESPPEQVADTMLTISSNQPKYVREVAKLIGRYEPDNARRVAAMLKLISETADMYRVGGREVFDEAVDMVDKDKGKNANRLVKKLSKYLDKCWRKIMAQPSRGEVATAFSGRSGLEEKLPAILLVGIIGIILYFLFSNVKITSNIIRNVSGINHGLLVNFIIVCVLGLVAYFYLKE